MKCNYKNRQSKAVAFDCECGERTLLEKLKVKTRKLELDVEESYYTCPHCKKENIVIKTNSEIRLLMEERDKLKNFNNNEQAKEFEILNQRIKELIDKFNNRN